MVVYVYIMCYLFEDSVYFITVVIVYSVVVSLHSLVISVYSLVVSVCISWW